MNPYILSLSKMETNTQSHETLSTQGEAVIFESLEDISTNNVSSIKTRRYIIIGGILSILGGLLLLVSSSALSQSLSSFSQSSVTSKNAASIWKGGNDNIYRARLSSSFSSRLDLLMVALLRKGIPMNDVQFKTYLTNLSSGIGILSQKPEYKNDSEVQNILGFLTYEINETIRTLGGNETSAINDIANLINESVNTEVAGGNQLKIYTSDAQNNLRDSFTIGETMKIAITGTNSEESYYCIRPPSQTASCLNETEYKKIGEVGDGWTKTNSTRMDYPELILIPNHVGLGTYGLFAKNGTNGAPVMASVTVNESMDSLGTVESIQEIAFSTSTTPAPTTTLPGTISPTVANVDYNGTQKLDIYLPTNVPSGAKIPVYIVVHGGGWDSGNKEMYNYMSKYYTDHGIAYVAINYTLANSSRAISDIVYKEIDCALKWTKNQSSMYNFDTTKINLLGISAGGHLSLQYGMNQSTYNDTSCKWGGEQVKLHQIVGIQAPTDLTADFSRTAWGDGMYLIENFIGEKRYSGNFPKKTRENSPVNFINKDNTTAKYYLFHGKKDDIVDYNTHAIPLLEKLRTNNYSVVFDSSDTTGHDTIALTQDLYLRIFAQMRSGN